MTGLRSGLGPGFGLPYITGAESYRLIRKAVARRRSLVYGQLEDGEKCCALGAYFKDNPSTAIPQDVAIAVARINDSLGKKASPEARRKKVLEWLDRRLARLAKREAK